MGQPQGFLSIWQDDVGHIIVVCNNLEKYKNIFFHFINILCGKSFFECQKTPRNSLFHFFPSFFFNVRKKREENSEKDSILQQKFHLTHFNLFSFNCNSFFFAFFCLKKHQKGENFNLIPFDGGDAWYFLINFFTIIRHQQFFQYFFV